MKNVNCEKDVQIVLVSGMIGSFGADTHMSLIESPDTSPGVFDINAAFHGLKGPRECWIELKYAREDEQVFKLRPTQYKWCKHRLAAGADNLYLLACVHVDGADHWCLFFNEAILDLKHHSGTFDKRRLRRIIYMANVMWMEEPDWDQLRISLSS